MSTHTPGLPEISIQPVSEVYDPNDERWVTQVQTLLSSLQANVGEVRKEVTPVPGQKGGLVEIIVALGSAGAITGMVEVFKAWLERDRTRVIEVTVMEGGVKKKIRVKGDNVSKELLSEAMKASLD